MGFHAVIMDNYGIFRGVHGALMVTSWGFTLNQTWQAIPNPSTNGNFQQNINYKCTIPEFLWDGL